MKNELLPTFELKIRSKIVLAELLFNLVPKTEPRMIAPTTRIANKQVGMTNLFFRYQGLIVNTINSSIKNTFREI